MDRYTERSIRHHNYHGIFMEILRSFFHGELIDHSKIIDGLIYGLIIDELLMMIDGLLMKY